MIKLTVLPIFALLLAMYFGRVPSIRAGLIAVAIWWSAAIAATWWVISTFASGSMPEAAIVYMLSMPIPIGMLATGLVVFVFVAVMYGRNEAEAKLVERREKARRAFSAAGRTAAAILSAFLKEALKEK